MTSAGTAAVAPEVVRTVAEQLAHFAAGLPAQERGRLVAVLEAAAEELAAGEDPEGLSGSPARDPFPALARLRAAGPVHWSEYRQAWLVTGFQEVKAIETGDRVSLARRYEQAIAELTPAQIEAMPTFLAVTKRHLGHMDAPEHGPARTLFKAALARDQLSRIERELRQIVADLVGGLVARRSFDAVQDFASTLPLLAVGALLGIPAGETEALEPAAAFYLSPFGTDALWAAQMEAATVHLTAYFQDSLGRRTDESEDALGVLAASAQPRGPYELIDVLAVCVQVLTGAYKSVRQLLSRALLALLAHPGSWAALCDDPDGVPAAIEETLRFDGVSQQLTRVASGPLRIGAQAIAPGDRILLCPAAAGRDPRYFEEPDVFAPERRRPAHLGFGAGPHACPGAAFARLVAGMALRAVVERLPGLRLDGEPRWAGQFPHRTLVALPVACSAR